MHLRRALECERLRARKPGRRVLQLLLERGSLVVTLGHEGLGAAERGLQFTDSRIQARQFVHARGRERRCVVDGGLELLGTPFGGELRVEGITTTALRPERRCTQRVDPCGSRLLDRVEAFEQSRQCGPPVAPRQRLVGIECERMHLVAGFRARGAMVTCATIDERGKRAVFDRDRQCQRVGDACQTFPGIREKSIVGDRHAANGRVLRRFERVTQPEQVRRARMHRVASLERCRDLVRMAQHQQPVRVDRGSLEHAAPERQQAAHARILDRPQRCALQRCDDGRCDRVRRARRLGRVQPVRRHGAHVVPRAADAEQQLVVGLHRIGVLEIPPGIVGRALDQTIPESNATARQRTGDRGGAGPVHAEHQHDARACAAGPALASWRCTHCPPRGAGSAGRSMRFRRSPIDCVSAAACESDSTM